jgi:alpha-glucoside transport system substrate-binding protein
VGAGSFWEQMTAWITGKDTKAALDAIEESWPS